MRNAARCIGPAHLSTRDTCAGRSASGSGSCQKRITLFRKSKAAPICSALIRAFCPNPSQFWQRGHDAERRPAAFISKAGQCGLFVDRVPFGEGLDPFAPCTIAAGFEFRAHQAFHLILVKAIDVLYRVERHFVGQRHFDDFVFMVCHQNGLSSDAGCCCLSFTCRSAIYVPAILYR